MDKKREGVIMRIMRSRFYTDGNQFTTNDIVNRLNARRDDKLTPGQINRLFSIMKQRGLLVDHRTNHHTGGRTTKWSRRRGSPWLQLPWRKHTNEQLGIDSDLMGIEL